MSKATANKTANKTTAITVKEANKKIENAEKLTQEEVRQLQETAQDRQLKFVSDFKKQVEKRKDIASIKVSSKNNITIHTANKSVAEICRKESYTVVYTCRCTDKKERNAILKAFKATEDIKTCNAKKYLDSEVETRIELIINSNIADKQLLDTIVKTCDSLKEQRQTMKKAK